MKANVDDLATLSEVVSTELSFKYFLKFAEANFDENDCRNFFYVYH